MQVLDSILPSICLGITLVAPVKAQITTDGTTNTTLTPTDKGIRIDEGDRAGGNLFHSFGEFSVPNGREAFFNNVNDVVNIFSRVTGGNISNIDGLIRANGGANLFLINPHGIIFGNNASLQIGGSFYGSNADSIIFSDGVEFAASNPVKPILTVNAPIGLRFRDSPGDIVNQSVAEGVGLSVAPGENLALIGGNIALEGGKITANEGRGNIELGSVAGNSVVNLEPVNSSFELGYDQAINFGNIALNQGAKIETSESNISLQGDLISLNNSSQITSVVNGSQVGGDININAKKLVINDRANIATATFAEADAGKINVDVSESIEIVGTGFEEFQQIFIIRPLDIDNSLDIDTVLNVGTGIVTVTDGIGAAGTIAIDSSLLKLQEGGVIGGLTFGEGDVGSVRINATDSVEVISSGIVNSPLLSSTGGGNILEINTLYLTVSDGGLVSSVTLGEENGGDIIVNASEQIDLLRGLPNSQVPTGIFSNSGLGNGEAGNITINTQRLNLQDGGQITSASGIATSLGNIEVGGAGGNITINADESIEISGGGSDNIFLNSAIASATFTENNAGNLNINTGKITISDSGAISTQTFQEGDGGNVIINSTGSLMIDDGAIFVGTLGSGNGGEVNITTANLSLTNGGRIQANNSGLGNAGNIFIQADALTLDNSSISATNNPSMPIPTNEESISGANINLTIKDNLILDNESVISAQAGENASGGNIDINAKFVIAFPGGNDILANAQQGTGGDINITAEGILGIEERSSTPPNNTNDIDASSEFGLSGNVIFNVPDTNSSQETAQLSSDVVVSAETVASDACSADNGITSFIIKGKGGVPPAPNLPLSGEVLLGDGKPITPNVSQLHNQEPNNNIALQVQPVKTSVGDIYPARGIIKTEDGRIILTPYPTADSPARFPDDESSCRLRDER